MGPMLDAVQALAPVLTGLALMVLGAVILDWCLHTPLRRHDGD